jgi:hypothetical protein
MKQLPTYFPDLTDIIKNCIYIDKTKYISNLIYQTAPFFFSRPRRFGKSLLLSTLEAIFKGQRELFKGLWIENFPYDWESYPVIKLSLADIVNCSNAEDFNSSLNVSLNIIARREKIVLTGDQPGSMFKSLISELFRKSDYQKKVVVLIDEYDAPLLSVIENQPLADTIRKSLKSFYGVLKTMADSLRFLFITGVSKFTKTSIFSELNYLTDLTLKKDFAGICGFTEEELVTNFGCYLDKSLIHFKKTGFLAPEAGPADLLDKIRQ